jgi:hypothetical protein
MTSDRDPGNELPGFESADLLAVALRAGAKISDRMLEAFRAQGLIPRPHRAGYRGRAPIWRYPPGADRQLQALLRWRERTKDPDVLQILLWLDGFPISAVAVRDALARQLASVIDAIEQEIGRHARDLGLDPADETARGPAIDALARTMAGKRGATPLVRRGRMRASDRTHAVALLVRVFVLGEQIGGSAHEGALVENVLGIAPNGRRHTIDGEGPWLTGPAEDLFGAAGIVGLPRLAETVADATEAELDAARQTVVTLFHYLPMMIRMVGVMFADDNHTGLAGLGQLDQQPEFVIYLVPMVMAMLKAGWKDNLDAVTSALQPFPELAAQAQRILGMPVAQVEKNMAGQPATVRQRGERLIEATIEGKFDVNGDNGSPGIGSSASEGNCLLAGSLKYSKQQVYGPRP